MDMLNVTPRHFNMTEATTQHLEATPQHLEATSQHCKYNIPLNVWWLGLCIYSLRRMHVGRYFVKTTLATTRVFELANHPPTACP